MTPSAVIFYVFASIALVAAVMVIWSRHPVHSAIYLVLTFLCVAGIYVLLQAEFIAAVQVLVYAGGIMVLFLFVIMLVNLTEAARSRMRVHAGVSALIGLAVVGLILYVYAHGHPANPAAGGALPGAAGNLQAVGLALYRDYVLPFEVASILLLVAMIGAIVLARQKA
ncbi:MAG TPA: NADH-quinone oxidoreductase subunit J [Candidatus Polarisedimenticolia bacterium]|nr:NADH-quinone oxidoreductase subunit J [Candidatus Polarisedimenticolia bacterium]